METGLVDGSASKVAILEFLIAKNINFSPNVFYAQVGDGDLDHSYWGTPENMKMKRPGEF